MNRMNRMNRIRFYMLSREIMYYNNLIKIKLKLELKN